MPLCYWLKVGTVTEHLTVQSWGIIHFCHQAFEKTEVSTGWLISRIWLGCLTSGAGTPHHLNIWWQKQIHIPKYIWKACDGQQRRDTSDIYCSNFQRTVDWCEPHKFFPKPLKLLYSFEQFLLLSYYNSVSGWQQLLGAVNW